MLVRVFEVPPSNPSFTFPVDPFEKAYVHRSTRPLVPAA
jgi:hypothetical protein